MTGRRLALAVVSTMLTACGGRDETTSTDAAAETGPAESGATDAGADRDVATTPETGPHDAGAADVADVADAGPACASPPAGAGWTPAALGASLVAWLDPGSIVAADGGGVSSWTDRSANHNDAFAFGAAPALGPKQLAGRDVVVFDGATTGMQILSSTSLAWALDDYLVEVVVRYTNAPSASDVNGYGVLWSHQDASSPWWGVGLFANTSGYWVGSSGPEPPASVFYGEIRTWGVGANGGVATAKQGYDDGTFHVVGMRRRAVTTLEMRVDGAPSASGPLQSHDVSATGRPVFLGGSAAGQFLAGSIAEIVAVRPAAGVALCDADVAALEAYLRAVNGL